MEPRDNPIDAFWHATLSTYDYTMVTLKAIGQFISGARSTKEMAGPIGIAKMSGDMASSGLTGMLLFMAILSINLGLINLFPVPVLDGGHLLFYLFGQVKCENIWMMAGTGNNRKYIPIKSVHNRLIPEILAVLLSFHALTGSDSMSYSAGINKKTSWKLINQYSYLLLKICSNEDLTDTILEVDQFVCITSFDLEKCTSSKPYSALPNEHG